VSKRAGGQPPYSYRTVFNFYDDIYPYRGPDDLWIDTVHCLIQCQVSLDLVLWIIGNEYARRGELGRILGLYSDSSKRIKVVRYSGVKRERKLPRGCSRASARKLKRVILKLTTMNEILLWAFEIYLLPHPEVYLHKTDTGKKIWQAITEEYSEVIKRNGGKPNKEAYTRKPLFPIEVMEWPRESLRGARGEKHVVKGERPSLDDIRRVGAKHR